MYNANHWKARTTICFNKKIKESEDTLITTTPFSRALIVSEIKATKESMLLLSHYIKGGSYPFYALSEKDENPRIGYTPSKKEIYRAQLTLAHLTKKCQFLEARVVK